MMASKFLTASSLFKASLALTIVSLLSLNPKLSHAHEEEAEGPVLYELVLVMSLYGLNESKITFATQAENDWELRLVDSLENKVLLSIDEPSGTWLRGPPIIFREFLARQDLRNIKVELIENDFLFDDEYLLGEIPVGEVMKHGRSFVLRVCPVEDDERNCSEISSESVTKKVTVSGSIEEVLVEND